MLADEKATVTYTIKQPFETGLKLVRKAIAHANLQIAGELDMSGRIRRSLLIQTAPCVVIFACLANTGRSWCDPLEAALSPLHIVVSARDSHTEVHILRVLPRGEECLAELAALQSDIAQTIESLGMRTGLVA
jgi:uncharacterized protein (DUF302 family)